MCVASVAFTGLRRDNSIACVPPLSRVTKPNPVGRHTPRGGGGGGALVEQNTELDLLEYGWVCLPDEEIEIENGHISTRDDTFTRANKRAAGTTHPHT